MQNQSFELSAAGKVLEKHIGAISPRSNYLRRVLQHDAEEAAREGLNNSLIIDPHVML